MCECCQWKCAALVAAEKTQVNLQSWFSHFTLPQLSRWMRMKSYFFFYYCSTRTYEVMSGPLTCHCCFAHSLLPIFIPHPSNPSGCWGHPERMLCFGTTNDWGRKGDGGKGRKVIQKSRIVFFVVVLWRTFCFAFPWELWSTSENRVRVGVGLFLVHIRVTWKTFMVGCSQNCLGLSALIF